MRRGREQFHRSLSHKTAWLIVCSFGTKGGFFKFILLNNKIKPKSFISYNNKLQIKSACGVNTTGRQVLALFLKGKNFKNMLVWKRVNSQRILISLGLNAFFNGFHNKKMPISFTQKSAKKFVL